MNPYCFSLSIVSHGHKAYIIPLLRDLARLGRSDIEVILTLNLQEDLGIDFATLPFPISLIRNFRPKAFAANHNSAFAICRGDYFVILNPDIRLEGDPFGGILAALRQSPDGVCAPLVVNEAGKLEDSARNFPTPAFLVKKLVAKVFALPLVGDFVPSENVISSPDWVAGMFIAVPRAIYERLKGLDERYRMYYEDVDFCARAHLAGFKVLVVGNVKVLHSAQRESHRNPRYLIWHLRSALRFFTSKAFLKIQCQRALGPE